MIDTRSFPNAGMMRGTACGKAGHACRKPYGTSHRTASLGGAQLLGGALEGSFDIGLGEAVAGQAKFG